MDSLMRLLMPLVPQSELPLQPLQQALKLLLYKM